MLTGTAVCDGSHVPLRSGGKDCGYYATSPALLIYNVGLGGFLGMKPKTAWL